MNTKLVVPYVERSVDLAYLPWQDLDVANWGLDVPVHAFYKLGHNATELFIAFKVNEPYVRALADDGGTVYEDSCCELFFAPYGQEQEQAHAYYNLEVNARGRVRFNYRNGDTKHYGTEEHLGAIDRDGTFCAMLEGFDNVKLETALEKRYGKLALMADGCWHLYLAIPLSAFYAHELKSFSKLRATGALFKCGDNLPTPYFLSTCKLTGTSPNFHQPACFQVMEFQEKGVNKKAE